MARMIQPETVAIELTLLELETLRTGLRHSMIYGSPDEEDRAQPLLADLSKSENV
ncbi:hypothetical protein [Streptomyces sp. NPDC020141]|uniref:hypothetical protein n=1 Tax=Streptomyces sp. NPDC020141 TaxID=3365065 RepID=UPI00379E5011